MARYTQWLVSVGSAVLTVLALVALTSTPVGQQWGLAAAGHPARAQDPSQVADDGALRELAERLLAPVGQPGGGTPAVELLPGVLPSDPALDLPSPPAGRLLGSAVLRLGGRPAAVDVVADVPGAAADVAT